MQAEYLVTGGAGFIGSNIVETLVNEGRTVRVLDDLSSGRRSNLAEVEGRFEWIEGSLLDGEVLERALHGVRFVLHLAALPSVVRSVREPELVNRVNVDGTLKLLVKARDAGIERVVFSSSSSVYGNTQVLPKHEDLPTGPLSPYAITKLAGEQYCRVFHALYGLKTFALRYFNVFGPRQNPNSAYAAVIPLFLAALARGEAPVLYGDGGQTRDFTYVENVVRANLACCTAPEAAAGQVYNVACGDRMAVKQLAQELARLMGREVAPVHAPERPGDVRDSQADNRRAREGLGWQPTVDIPTGLRRTLEWFVKHES
ncbi:MAG: SDR family oxidoreductase [Candidatus Marinimicrobia bacterium]|nr:SDR family oxidoreductase [Candidatus Neomarinimicrobiota bacterium]